MTSMNVQITRIHRDAQLPQYETADAAGFDLVGASCHDAEELDRARRIDADFVVLGPVQATASHPDAAPLGWPRFAALLENYALPAYALGGLKASDLETAWRAGAHGVSMMRAAWEP